MKNWNDNYFNKVVKSINLEQKKEYFINLTTKFDFEKIKLSLNENLNNIIYSTSSIIKNIKKNNDKNDIIILMTKFDKDGILKFRKLKKLLNQHKKEQKLSQEVYLLEEKNLEQERAKMLEDFIEKTSNINFEFDNLKFIRNYQNKLSKSGFIFLKSAEGIFIALSESKKYIEDYSAIYIMYTKFIETEISEKFNCVGKNICLAELIKKIEKKYEWEEFLSEFNRLDIRKKRNLAAHGGNKSILFSDVEELREFILSEKAQILM